MQIYSGVTTTLSWEDTQLDVLAADVANMNHDDRRQNDAGIVCSRPEMDGARQLSPRPVALYVDRRPAGRAVMWQALPAVDVMVVGDAKSARTALFGPAARGPSRGVARHADMVLVRGATFGEEGLVRWMSSLAHDGFLGTRCVLLDAEDP